MSKIIKYGDLPLVSSDYAGTNQSTIFDADLTLSMGDNQDRCLVRQRVGLQPARCGSGRSGGS